MTPERERELKALWDDAVREQGKLIAERDSLRLALDASEKAVEEKDAHLVHAQDWNAALERDLAAADALTRAEKLRADTAEAALAESRAREVALVEAATAFRDAVADDNVTCRDNGIDSAQAVEDVWTAIDAILADLSTAAREWRERVRAEARVKNGCKTCELRAMGVNSLPTVSELERRSLAEASAIATASEEGRRAGHEEAAKVLVDARAAMIDPTSAELIRRIRALSTSPAASVLPAPVAEALSRLAPAPWKLDLDTDKGAAISEDDWTGKFRTGGRPFAAHDGGMYKIEQAQAICDLVNALHKIATTASVAIVNRAVLSERGSR